MLLYGFFLLLADFSCDLTLLLLWPWYLLCYSDAEWFNSQNPNILISVWLSDFLSGRLCLVGPEDWSGVWGADWRSGQTLWLRTDPSGGRWRKCKHLHTNKTCFLKNMSWEACQCLTLITDTMWPLRSLKTFLFFLFRIKNVLNFQCAFST